MYIDKQTLSDLDIFKPDEAGLSFFDFIDKTQTTGGKHRLRDKLLNPPDSFEKLMSQQDAVRFFAGNSKNFILPVSDRQMKSFERYISSNIDIPTSGSFFESMQFFLGDIHAYREIKVSIKEILVFIASFQKSLALVDHKTKSNLLKLISNVLLSFTIDKDFEHIRTTFSKHDPWFFEVLKCDGILRTRLKPLLREIFDYYYEIDTLLAMAKVGNEHQFVFPELLPGETCTCEMQQLHHPLISDAVPYSVNIDKDSNFIFLTGPNMAGKTTFLKATGIAVYLAHLGMAVPAHSARISYFDHLFTSINIPDNVLNGYSYFFSEVKRVKQLAEILNGGARVFSLFDELFRGTNIKDAYDASHLIISGFVQWKNSIFILSSHLIELWDKIKCWPNAGSFYFESEIKDGVPVFTYRLLEGVSEMRLGLTIVQNENIMNLLNSKKHD